MNADIGDVSHLTTAVNSTNAAHEAAINMVLDAIAAEKPNFVLVAGDMVNGHWHSDASGVQVFGPVRNLAEKRAAVAAAADVYYTQWKERFAARGLDVHVAVGDHELGDNNWPANNDKAFLVADYKEAFAKHFTRDAYGRPRYDKRPVGTPFANTSYAVRHKNILIVSVDEFRQDDPTRKLDDTTGSVAADVAGDHLAWLDKVITEVKAKPQIKHVIVQGHVPVLPPVRRQSSSGLTLRGGADSEFWKTLVKNGVDLYFAGEVHDMSAANHDGVEQVVHGGILGYAPNANYLVGKVYPDRIELELKRFELMYPSSDTSRLWQAGSNRPRAQYAILANGASGGFVSAGTLVIDKSSGSTVYQNRTGYFVPIDAPPGDGLSVHLPFDEVPGSTIAINAGTSGALHNGVVDGATYRPGKLGNAVSFDALDRIVTGPTPIVGAAARTTSLWVRMPTRSTAIRTAFHFGTNATGRKWDVDIDGNGNFEIGVGFGRVDSRGSRILTDGAWHHLTAVVPAGVTTLDGIKLYVDGEPIAFTAPATPIDTASEGKLVLGHSANAIGVQQYAGDIDDLAIWNRPLSAIEVRALVSLADIQYDARKVDALLTAFDDATDAEIDGKTWKYQASGLTGPEGVVVATSSNQYELHLGGGAGLVMQ